MMTKFVLVVVAVLAFASLGLADPVPVNELDAELELLDSGYNQAVSAFEAAIEADENRLEEFKREYAEQIELLKEGIENGSITAETLDNNEQYQKVRAEIQQLAHKGQLGVSTDEVLDGIQKGLDIGEQIINSLRIFG